MIVGRTWGYGTAGAAIPSTWILRAPGLSNHSDLSARLCLTLRPSERGEGKKVQMRASAKAGE